MTIKQIKQEYVYHHTASARGYISRRKDGIIEPYKGRFGTGYKIMRPRWDTTQYCYVDYYVKDERGA